MVLIYFVFPFSLVVTFHTGVIKASVILIFLLVEPITLWAFRFLKINSLHKIIVWALCNFIGTCGGISLVLQKEVESVQAAWTSSHLQEGDGQPASTLCFHQELLIFSSLLRTAAPLGLPPKTLQSLSILYAPALPLIAPVLFSEHFSTKGPVQLMWVPPIAAILSKRIFIM